VTKTLDKRTAQFFADSWEKGYIAGTQHGLRQRIRKGNTGMRKTHTERWPLRVWCVCYRAEDYPGGWVPYSGSIYYYRREADEDSAGRPGSKIKRFYIGPRRALPTDDRNAKTP
jgi:hypothetical protein